jgi:hypothetical protein
MFNQKGNSCLFTLKNPEDMFDSDSDLGSEYVTDANC